VIDAHDTMVYCSAKAHKCIFSSLNEPNVKKVEVDYKSWQSAFAAASQIHQLLAGDDELAGGVQGWGHKGDPTTTFVNALVLLRSGERGNTNRHKHEV
jgi:rhodanese-related sulfurtransferase